MGEPSGAAALLLGGNPRGLSLSRTGTSGIPGGLQTCGMHEVCMGEDAEPGGSEMGDRVLSFWQ